MTCGSDENGHTHSREPKGHDGAIRGGNHVGNELVNAARADALGCYIHCHNGLRR
jgi:hypothetical protein